MQNIGTQSQKECVREGYGFENFEEEKEDQTGRISKPEKKQSKFKYITSIN